MTRDLTHDEILGLIDWQRSMGVDAAVGDSAIDWLQSGRGAPGSAFTWPPRWGAGGATTSSPQERTGAQPAFAAQSHAGSTPARATPAGSFTLQPPAAPALRMEERPQTPLAPSAAETEARQAARQAQSLEGLGAALRAFDGCGLKATAKNLCFYRGAPRARLMLIGEAPGRDEDIEGKPFVGRAGQLLDKMLAAIGLGEEYVHITNIVYWRPPGNRTPTPQEALACRPFLERQMELVAPEIVVALGGAAAKEMFGVGEGIMRLRGKWRQIAIGGRQTPALATLHPAYLLRTPAAKGLAWADLQAIKRKLSAPG